MTCRQMTSEIKIENYDTHEFSQFLIKNWNNFENIFGEDAKNILEKVNNLFVSYLNFCNDNLLENYIKNKLINLWNKSVIETMTKTIEALVNKKISYKIINVWKKINEKLKIAFKTMIFSAKRLVDYNPISPDIVNITIPYEVGEIPYEVGEIISKWEKKKYSEGYIRIKVHKLI